MSDAEKPKAPRRLRRTVGRMVLLSIAAGVTFLLVDGCRSFGKAAAGDRLVRVEASPQRGDGIFENPQPMWNDFSLSVQALWNQSDVGNPAPGAIPVVKTDPALFNTPPASGLRVTWLGHSTQLIELDGVRVLTDPIFEGRASPYEWIGPDRWYPPPLPLEQLPALDAIVISHDHYDHLQMATVDRLKHLGIPWIVPLGVAAHLEYWGVPVKNIVELDWWETTTVKGVTVACTPARHASGRHVLDQNTTLWASYAFVGPVHRAYFSGDTGLFVGMKEIGDRYGPFDVTMIEAGAYGPGWPDWHLGPEQAVLAHTLLRGKVMLPVHWGLWQLAAHGWTEPMERVLAAAQNQQVVVAAPRPGESFEPANVPATVVPWWPTVPWQNAEQDPIVARNTGL
jgi:L-ascorbate metabolism protein UlaG (beta-lactamase superfamily)